MRTVTLNNGTICAVEWCGASDGILHIHFAPEAGDGARAVRTVDQAAALLSDTEAVRRVVSHPGSNLEAVFDGYTRLISLGLENDGAVHATLKRGVRQCFGSTRKTVSI